MPFLFNIKIPRFLKFSQWSSDCKADVTVIPVWQLKFQHLQPLKSVIVPQIPEDYQSYLSNNGWAGVAYRNAKDPLQIGFQELLQASRLFFELPESEKRRFITQQGSEEGWTRIEGEKEFITLRSIDGTPQILANAASKFWDAAGSLLNEQLGSIAESLGLPTESLTVYSQPCTRLNERTATMLRLFRYEGYDGQESKIVAEEHKDLGLLSLVVGDTPGLEVWDRYVNKWYCLERTFTTPAASVLVGRQLECLSNGRYIAGGHRVRSYPDHAMPRISTPGDVAKKYRYSIVFVLRAHSPMPINTDDLTTDITGGFEKPLRNISAGEMFQAINSSHYNINTHKEEREEQKRKLAETEETSASTMR